MTIKDHILDLLEEAQGEYLSGEALAQKLSVSRNTVWRAIKSLESEGYEFSAVTNRGYCLLKKPDRLNLGELKKLLPPSCNSLNIQLFDTITSTNTVLKAMAEEGAPEGTLLIASEQTAGRGRMNRTFYSPAGTGVYMSLLVRPELPPEKSLYMTTAAAVAVAEAIETVTQQQAKIKWVNDIYLHGKKVCGILTEASFNMESKRLAYAVVGLGINMREPEGGFPAELQPIVTSVFNGENYSPQGRNRIIAEVLIRFLDFYARLEEKPFLEGYKKRSLLFGKTVNVIGGGCVRGARALDIDDEFRLHVAYPDGSQEYLQSGEVSVKPAACGGKQ
ncbi:MAG: biotin--[acetyl-CoA-carboxylase] ligase [Pyramidobacter sp.]|jgi:BirA family biotin operon repressor/biotin-[acetyl-CoA-carboxylase] ligase